MGRSRGYFGIGVYQPKTPANIGTLWRSAQNFGADFLFTIGHRYRIQASDTPKTTRHIPLFEYQSFEQFMDSMPKEALLTGIEQCQRSKMLNEAHHDERAVYILGAEDNGLPEHIITRCHRVVAIDTPMCLNVAVAGSIVMYDRMTKLNLKAVGGGEK